MYTKLNGRPCFPYYLTAEEVALALDQPVQRVQARFDVARSEWPFSEDLRDVWADGKARVDWKAPSSLFGLKHPVWVRRWELLKLQCR